MTDNSIDLTRRKLLGGIGTIGVAGATAGLGTSAYYSDGETFESNTLTAGELDMKVDWEEHYSDWSDDEDDAADAADGPLDIQMDVSDASEYTAFPPGVNDPGYDGDPLLYVLDDDVGQFMDNTAIDAFPDSDNDGVQDDFDRENACEVLTDVGSDDAGLDPDGARTDNEDTRLDDGSPAPLVNLNDVKPGDFGEATLSFHLCDNPGYVWLQGQPVRVAEGGHTEPEAEDSDEVGAADESLNINQAATVDDLLNSNVELLDAIQTAWWYDNDCNNLTAGEAGTVEQQADVVLVLDNSGSIGSSDRIAIQNAAKTFIDELASVDQAAGVAFAEDAAVEQELTQLDGQTDIDAVKNTINNYGDQTTGSQTNIDAGLEAANGELESSRARDDATPVIVLLSDGAPTTNSSGFTDTSIDPDGGGPHQQAALEEADTVKESGKRIITIGYDLDVGDDTEELLRAISGTQDNSSVEFERYFEGSIVGRDIEDADDFFSAPDPSDLQGQFEDIAGSIGTGEEIFFQGSLRTALTALSTDLGIPLDGDGGNDFDEIAAVLGDGDSAADERGCFEPTPATNCIGFSWWLPVDHANEIQSDSVTFDLGFYTEQCRHNDGSGQST